LFAHTSLLLLTRASAMATAGSDSTADASSLTSSTLRVEGGAELFVTCAWDDAARSFDVEVVTCAPSTGAVTAWHARDVTAPASVSFPNWYERAQMALCGVDAANHFAFAFATPSADVAKLKWRWHERFVQGRGVSGGGGEKNDANRSADAANPEPSNPRRGVDRALMPARLDAPVLERAGGQLAGTVVLSPSTRSFVGEDPSSAAEKIFTPPAALAAFASRLSALNAALRRRCKRDAIALASLRRTTDFANAALREAAETRERRDGDVAASVALLLNSKKRRVRALEEDLANWRERAEALEDERDELKKQLRERRLGGDSRSSTPKREEDHSERSDDRSDDRSREDRTSEDEDEDGVAGGGVSVSGSGLGLDAPPRAEDTNTPRAADLESKVAPRKRAREEGGDPFPSSQGPSQRSQGPSQRVGSQRVGSQRGRGRAPGKRTVADDLGDELFDM
jgi:hypothetical protein